ncbi:LolA family protein [Desulfobulbus propionicus]
MFNRLLFRLFLTVVLVSCVSAKAWSSSQQNPVALIDRLQITYQRLHSLQFNFTQVTETNGRLKEGSGSATFYRTKKSKTKSFGIMRWDYIEPNPQVILNNGKELSIYTPQDKQLIISPAQSLETDITYAIFTGTKKLMDEFEITAPDAVFWLNEPPEGMQSVQLVPRQPHSQIKRLQLWVDAHHVLQRLLLEDHFGALTELSFTQIQFNKLPPHDHTQEQSLMQLDLAPGTEVIRQ